MNSRKKKAMEAGLVTDAFIYIYFHPLVKYLAWCFCSGVFFFLTFILYWSISTVQWLSCVWLFATPWTVAHQASLSITSSWSLPKLMSIELVMPFNNLILCHPLSLLPSIFPSIKVFPNESVLRIRWSKYRSSASASVLPMNIKDWFLLGLTFSIPWQSKGLSRVFSNTTVQKHQFFFNFLYGLTLTSICNYWKNHSFD